MAKIFIFSGTTEGRELSEFLCKNNIKNSVFVATEYGEIVMKENENCTIQKGRLTLFQMIELFSKEKPDFVIDATHPYAVQVTDNIIEACTSTGIRDNYYRLQRDIPKLALEDEYIDIVYSTEEAIKYLCKTTGSILLTTGVKSIHEYAGNSDIHDRIYARILPSKESIELAYEAGLIPRQIIAMEGPFSTEINEAFINQYNIKYLVTKNSGQKGGLDEKLSAVKNTGIKAVVICQKEMMTGYSTKQILNILMPRKTLVTNIALVGIGVGNKESITAAAISKIEDAEIIIGASRMVEFGKTINSSAKYFDKYKSSEILNIVKEYPMSRIVVLYSGDTGFYSGATKSAKVLSAAGFNIDVFPAVSSISYFSSKIGIDYSDATIISCHGKEVRIEDFINSNKVFSIMSGVDDVNYVLREICGLVNSKTIYIGYNLGREDEQIIKYNTSLMEYFEKEGLYVLGVFDNE